MRGIKTIAMTSAAAQARITAPDRRMDRSVSVFHILSDSDSRVVFPCLRPQRHVRSPLPRFTILDDRDIEAIYQFFLKWGKACLPVLVPGAHIAVASNPLVSYRVSAALADAGFERRGEVIRLVMTLRGGDRPKNAHEEFPEVSVMARSMWEPWLLFRKRFSGRVQDNLRRWGTGGLRRPSHGKPFGDVIASHPTRSRERRVAPHPSLKPQSFLRPLVRAMLPLGSGVVLDPFAGSGSTLAAAEAVGYRSIGVESDPAYLEVARAAIPRLHQFEINSPAGDKPSSRLMTANASRGLP
jgi:DNA modification methylase